MLTIKGIKLCFGGIPEICDFDKTKMWFLSQNSKKLFSVRNVLFRLRNTTLKTASYSDHPLIEYGRFCVSHFRSFCCLMLFALKCVWNSLSDLIVKGSYLVYETSDLDGIFSVAFAFMWTTILDKNQNFEIFGQNHVVFLSKIQSFLEFHHYIILFLR